ncbi:snoRNA-binding rRNA-processing protein imp4 [Geranomyces variabilis]|nr:snoRNA-binding rRNA-processing protein imp4 [Geranomyces variabilis]
MIRRQSRLRREYLYRKALETKDRQIYERKQELKEALESGRPIPGELRKEASALQKDLQYDENQTVPTNHIDDEYAQAGVHDPKILITTSRDPSSRLAQFAKEMRLMFPNSQRINRGNYVLKDIVDACKSNDATDLVILHEHRGQPDGMVVCHFPYGPTAYFTLHNVVLRHDIADRGTVSEQYPHLIFNGFNSKLGNRAQNILKYLFPVPKEDSKRVMTFANDSDFISFRHHVYYKVGNEVQLAEVGPRFEMRLYEIKLGTVEVTEADTEWVFRPYQRTAKKRDFL